MSLQTVLWETKLDFFEECPSHFFPHKITKNGYWSFQHQEGLKRIKLAHTDVRNRLKFCSCSCSSPWDKQCPMCTNH